MISTEWLTISLAFLEGLALILSPCILPILPIILSASLQGSRKRPLGIIIGFIICFSLMTFFSRQLVLHTGIDLLAIRYISYVLLIGLGIVMLSTNLTEKFASVAQKLTATGSNLKSANDTQGGFLSGFAFGCLVGVIWTPCAGPILAAVIVQTVIQQTTLGSFLTVMSFSVGVAVPMLLIALFGRVIMNQFSFFKTHTIQIRKLMGVIIILAVGYMIYAEKFSTSSSGRQAILLNQDKLINPIEIAYPAPAIEGIAEWINSKPLRLEQLKGEVILIDFWTYSCINCIRTFPYLKAWYAKYHDKGLVIIGVHAPEFEFEKNVDNVKSAVQRNGIIYPVALDNQFATWQNYANRYWPAHYLIDKKGNVVYKHFGEGDYDVTENNIRFLLGLNKMRQKVITETVNENQTPETYLGTARMERFASPESIVKNYSSTYTYPIELKINHWALRGSWLIELDKVVATKPNAEVEMHFNAKNVFVVMGSLKNIPIKVKILLNGQVIQEIEVDRHQLYTAVSLKNVAQGILQLKAEQPGLEIYTFTFG